LCANRAKIMQILKSCFELTGIKKSPKERMVDKLISKFISLAAMGFPPAAQSGFEE